MGKWLELAAKLESERAGDVRDIRDESPACAPIVPIVPIVPASLSASHLSSLKGWRAGLSALDPEHPRGGIGRGRWHALVHDAFDLFNGWAPQAAALGWTDAELFGVDPSLRPDHQVLHGLAWRCDGFKVVALTDYSATLEGKASRTPGKYYRGDASRLVPIWRLPA